MKTYSSRAIIAVAALVALIGSVSVFTAEAVPVFNGVNVREEQGQALYQAAAVLDRVHKRAVEVVPPTTTVPISTTEKPKTTTPVAHTTTTVKAATTIKTTAKAATTTSHSTAVGVTTGTATSGAGLPVTGTASGAAPSATTGTGDNGVPTQVSEKVFIGLGTVGGFFVFALGGLAFCRHRKKKNLASALLQQTAQFNNNNPYAKLPEPAATPKESLPMTPTKPLGTYTVVTIYTPALPDEIELGHGDSVTILQEYDDGWCMGVNNSRNGIKGVFPRHCVEMGPYEGSQHGAPGGPHFPPSPSFKAAASKRMSSIAPASGWDGPGYYGGGGNYPPQPSPQYLGPNQGPPNQGPPYQGGGGGGYYQGGGY